MVEGDFNKLWYIYTVNRYAVINECCCCSFIKSCPILCSLKDCSTPGFLPSLSPGVCSNSCLMSQWCHATISSSVIPFSSYLQSFLASGFSPMSQLFTAGGQSIGASAAVLPMNIQGWFSLGWTDLISLQSQGLSRVFFSTTVSKCLFFSAHPSLWSNSHLIHDYWKNHRFDYMDLFQESNVFSF